VKVENLIVELTCELINKLRRKGLMVSYLSMDSFREIKLLEARGKSSDWQFEILFQYTANQMTDYNLQI